MNDRDDLQMLKIGYDFHNKRFNYQRVARSWDQLSYQSWVVFGSGGPASQPPGSAHRSLWNSDPGSSRHGSLNIPWRAPRRLSRLNRVFAMSQWACCRSWNLMLERVLLCAVILVPGWTLDFGCSESRNLPSMRMCSQSWKQYQFDPPVVP